MQKDLQIINTMVRYVSFLLEAKNMFKFTIVTVCYNEEDSITQTIESVLHQSYDNYEYIIIDGASTDNTLNILENYKDPTLRIYSEHDKGISDAFNKGIAYSKGEYLCFLNSGDYFLNQDVLRNVAKDLETHSEDIVCYSIKHIINNYFPKNEKEGKELWETSLIPHQGSFTKRDVFSRVGGFNTYFKVRMDYDFFSRCYRQGVSFKCIPRLIVCYDSSGVSSTDAYHVQKEGLAIRLLYKEEVDENEIQVMQYLLKKNGKTESVIQDELERQRKLVDKNFKIMMAMNSWIYALQNGKRIIQFFEKMSARNIAIYGWGYLGKCLANELQNSYVKVKYIIDQNKKGINDDIEVYDWNDLWPDVDLIVVTPFYEYKDIKNRIREKIDCNVVSIEKIIIRDCVYEN